MKFTEEQIQTLKDLIDADIGYHEKQQDTWSENDEIWKEHEDEINKLLEIRDILDRG